MTGNFNIVNGKQVTHYAGLFALSARDGRRREQLAAFLQRQWPIDQSERLYFARSCKCLEEWEARFQQLALEIDKFRLISIEHNLRFSFFFWVGNGFTDRAHSLLFYPRRWRPLSPRRHSRTCRLRRLLYAR